MIMFITDLKNVDNFPKVVCDNYIMFRRFKKMFELFLTNFHTINVKKCFVSLINVCDILLKFMFSKICKWD